MIFKTVVVNGTDTHLELLQLLIPLYQARALLCSCRSRLELGLG